VILPRNRRLLESWPTLGWVQATPISEEPELAERLGLKWLGFKRDDQLPLLGGSKIRKLNTLLAAPPWASARTLRSLGAIGSGQLLALAEAAQLLNKRCQLRLFWEPPAPKVLENLALLSQRPCQLRYSPNRLHLALRSPRLLAGQGPGVIAPGASHPLGVMGMVQAGLELADQIEAGLLPPPDRLLLPQGTGGCLAGLALGLGMAGLKPLIQAVVVVERPLTWGLEALLGRCRALIHARGGEPAPLPPIHQDHRWLGPGYGIASLASAQACARCPQLPLEPIYSAKALAALLNEPPQGERVLFWLTPRQAQETTTLRWERLPRALRKRLQAWGHQPPQQAESPAKA